MRRLGVGVCAIALASAPLLAHGGMYMPPPNPRSVPGPGAPSTGGPAPVGPTMGGPTTPGGFAADPTRWELWWEIHRLAYLDAKHSVHGDEAPGADAADTNTKRVTRPLKAELIEIAELLKKTLESSSSKDVSSACLVALAKVGIDGETFKLTDVLRRKLDDNEQELRETAALALGISQRRDALPLLLHLVRDDQDGRRMVGRGLVDDRVRSFAAYGLGLLAWATEEVADKEQVLAAMKEVLEDKDLVSRNLKVAAIQALRLLRCDPAAPAQKRVLWSALSTLEKYFLADLGRGTQLVQAHVPTAVARLLEQVPGDDRERWNKLFLEELTAAKRRDATITQSCAIALGFLAMPGENKPADAELSKALQHVAKKHQDQQTRHYAMISLGRIRGEQNRADLLASLASAKMLDRPWLALALGVFQHEVEKADAPLQAALVAGLEGESEPSTVAGIAIACGLARAANAAPTIRNSLLRFKHQDTTMAHLCVALGLLDDKASQPMLEQLLVTATRRPEIIRGAALGLAKLAGPAASDVLAGLLESGDTSTARLAGIAQALEIIGDRRAIKSLTAVIQRLGSTSMARAFAIAALGGIADKEELPWGTKIAFGVNYTAPVETLIDGSSGILDIL